MTTSSESTEATPSVVRGLQAVGFVFSIAEVSAWITVLVVAFDRGGAGAAGLAVVVQLVPTALMAPVVTAAGDRFPRHLVLAVGFTVLAASAIGIAISLASSADLWVVLLLAAAYTVALESTPATVASLLVRHARTPTQLMQWNVAQSSAQTAGSLLGPLLTSALLVLTGPSLVFAVLAAMCALTAVGIAARLPPDDRRTSTTRLRTVARASADGVAYAASTPGPRRVIAFIAAAGLLIGSFDVFFVAVAFDELGRGGSTAAMLSAGFAAGGLIASTMMRRRSTWSLPTSTVAGALLLSVPLIPLGHVSQLAAALLLVGILGAGNVLVEICGYTMLQRSSSESMTSRVFGILRSWFFLAASVGAAITGFLVTRHDLSSLLVLTGVAFAGILSTGAFALRRMATRSVAVDSAALEPLRTVGFLDRLPLPTLEELAGRLEVREVDAGCEVITEGDEGDEFFILVEGVVEFSKRSLVVDTVAAPCSFGEIALLHECVRTATVTTTQPSRLLVIERRDFLDAIGRTTTSRNMALDVADRFRTPPDPLD
jgi:predicted MFS family arabinose efflux permease